MVADLVAAKEPGQQGQDVSGKGRVDEGFRPPQGLNRAAAWLPIVVLTLVANPRIELGCERGEESGVPATIV